MSHNRIDWLSWNPKREVAYPILGWAAGVFLLYLGIRFFGNQDAMVLLWVWSAGFLLLPVVHSLNTETRSPETLGITEKNWPPAMAVGMVLGLLLVSAQIYYHLYFGMEAAVPQMSLAMLAFCLSLLLVVAGEEVFFRGWMQSLFEPAFGLAPSIVLASAAYALYSVPFIVFGGGLISSAGPPAGYITALTANYAMLLLVALFFNVVFRITHSVWSSGLANFLSKFGLVFLWQPVALIPTQPKMVLALTLALWVICLLQIRRWFVHSRSRRTDTA